MLIAVCPDPRAPHWQLGPLPPAQGQMLLIGWHAPEVVDAGVPPAVADLLARCLTRFHHLTFLAGDGRASIATGETQVAVRLFDLPAWAYQGQVGLLSVGHARAVDPATFVADDWIARAARAGVGGAVRPGVDGDVVGLWLAEAEMAQAMLAELATEAAAAALHLEVAGEGAFRDLIAGG